MHAAEPVAPSRWSRRAEGTESGGGRRAWRKRPLRIFPYAVSHSRLERAIRELAVSAVVVDRLEEADLVVTLKSQERRAPKRLREAETRGKPLHIVRSNTASQLAHLLRGLFDLDEVAEEQALRAAEEAVAAVYESAQPIELGPQSAFLRRLQHQVAERCGLASTSRGEEPYRRLVIFPK